ncbi:MAG: peptide ABC transporter substrate-binding protein [Acidimicrobiia bacterium]|nr:peptide ABC transporter substrate-binding protein [Acidimicrobiia bacterium]
MAVTASACNRDKNGNGSGQGGEDDGERRKGGDIVMALEEEPSGLNPWTSVGRNPATAAVAGPILAQLISYTPDFGYEPVLLAELPELAETEPMKVRYRIRDEAVWDDGSPVTAADVQYTLTQVLAPANDVLSRDGYELIKDGTLSDVSQDGKSFTLAFTEPYGPWLELFASSAQPILQAVKMQGQDFNSALNDGIPFASGPYKLGTWTKGNEIVLVRNDAWWGDGPYLDEIHFRFAEAKDLQVAAIREGEANAVSVYRTPDVALELREVPNITVQTTGGPLWEHLDFNLQDPLLGLTEVRQAIGYAIDRGEIVNEVAKPINPAAVVLNNVFFVPEQKQYRPNWEFYRRDPGKVEELLTQAGFTRGADNVWAKGAERLSFVMSTTKGNALRERTAKILQRQLAEVGIELQVEELDSATLFDRLPNCEYQIALFAYRGGPDPSWANSLYREDERSCPGEGQNVEGANSLGYRDIEVSEILRAADMEPNQRKRAQLYDTADELIAKDIPTLPLFQNATVLAFDSGYANLEDNPTIQGPTWNVQEWWLRRAPETSTTAPATSAP